ncbi:allantoate amidohydrolase [Meiothermus granaticius]|uniref:N-carbamoyl-L-amino acid hydrolase n=1 Tax=Meiothermus granaticius NBRC 107808 TaxID=1227551 RepID=A0A399FEF2_9DEIN|nr:allantoate amidohydrolase [Meiothermus granaticius]RIH93331.1 N-carbamoyl-L-amino acid hydrolase [Meiothermus granaticius NBRC 107808]GEM85862.1 Zn-dependent hydrolase [Meiothermus granaticius NBRC 107808]
MDPKDLAAEALRRCRVLARFSEEPGRLTRTFLSPPMREVQAALAGWMGELGMEVRVDGVGNLIGRYEGRSPGAQTFLLGSHVDTVRDAGKYDGVLGVMLGLALVQGLEGRRLPFALEVIAFSEEEGVRYRMPFLGSRAVTGTFDPELLQLKDAEGLSLAEAIRAFGLDPDWIPRAAYAQEALLGYLEFHIEQGPVLESLGLPLGIVEAIAGQTRLEVIFRGRAGHAGATPMPLRRDALAGAAEWMTLVEREARGEAGLVATVGTLQVSPGAVNVIPGEARLSLDVRHAYDEVRERLVAYMVTRAQQVAQRRGLELALHTRSEQPAVPCDEGLNDLLEEALQELELPVHRLVSGAGHDAMILAPFCPSTLLFLRSPQGLSHHPDEAVWPQDVEAAVRVGLRFLERLEARWGQGKPGPI